MHSVEVIRKPKHVATIVILVVALIAVIGIRVTLTSPRYQVRRFLDNITIHENNVINNTGIDGIGFNTYTDRIDDDDILALYHLIQKQLTITFQQDPEIYTFRDSLDYPSLNWFWNASDGYVNLEVGQANDNNYIGVYLYRTPMYENDIFTRPNTSYQKRSGITARDVVKILDRSTMVNVFDHLQNK